MHLTVTHMHTGKKCRSNELREKKNVLNYLKFLMSLSVKQNLFDIVLPTVQSSSDSQFVHNIFFFCLSLVYSEKCMIGQVCVDKIRL